MKAFFTKCLKVLGVVMGMFVLVYLALHIAGVGKIKIGELDLNFQTRPVNMGIFFVTTAGLIHDRIDATLSAREVGLDYQVRKQRRWSLRIVLWSTWFAIYVPIYAWGQYRYYYLNNVGLIDLLFVLFYGLILVFAIPLPQSDEPKAEADNSSDSAMT